MKSVSSCLKYRIRSLGSVSLKVGTLCLPRRGIAGTAAMTMGCKLALGRVIEVGLGAISGGSDSIDGELSISERVFVVGESVNCLKSVSSDERLRLLLSSVSGDVELKSIGTNCSVVTGK